METDKLIDRSERILIDFMEVMVSRDLLVSQILDSNLYTHDNIKKLEFKEFKLEDVIKGWNERNEKNNIDRYLQDVNMDMGNIEESILELVGMDNSIIPTNISTLFNSMITKSFVDKAYIRVNYYNKKEVDWLISLVENSGFKDIISIIDISTPLEEVISEKNITTYITKDIDLVHSLNVENITKDINMTVLVANYGFNMIDLGEGLLALKYEPSELPKSEKFKIVSVGLINIWDYEDEELTESVG